MLRSDLHKKTAEAQARKAEGLTIQGTVPPPGGYFVEGVSLVQGLEATCERVGSGFGDVDVTGRWCCRLVTCGTFGTGRRESAVCSESF